MSEMNDDELRRRVQYAAQLHGVSPQEVVTAMEGEDFDEPVAPEELANGEAVGEPVAKRRGVAHRVAWVSSMVVMGVVVGLVIVGIMKFVNDPAEAHTKTYDAAKASVSPKATGPDVSLLAGLNFDLNYPGRFDQVAQLKTDPQVIEQYRLTSKTNYKHTITVDLRPLVSGGLRDDSSYRVRKMNMTATYAESTLQIAGEPVTLMTRDDEREQTLFWPHQGRLLTVSATSSDPDDDVKAFMKVITAQVKWHK